MISQETDNKTITQDQQPEPSLKYKLHKAPFKNASPAYTDVIIKQLNICIIYSPIPCHMKENIYILYIHATSYVCKTAYAYTLTQISDHSAYM